MVLLKQFEIHKLLLSQGVCLAEHEDIGEILAQKDKQIVMMIDEQ